MTDTITIRLRRPKAELAAKAKPNINAWVNQLIDHALGPQKPDWNATIERSKTVKPSRYLCDEMRKANR